MRLSLERRAETSTAAALASPLLAVALTLATAAIMFAALERDPWRAPPAMLAAGAGGGALHALIPATLNVRFGANEIPPRPSARWWSSGRGC